MKAIICDRCKNVFTESDYAEVEVALIRGNRALDRNFDLCRDCKKWLYKELGVKESWDEKRRDERCE